MFKAAHAVQHRALLAVAKFRVMFVGKKINLDFGFFSSSLSHFFLFFLSGFTSLLWFRLLYLHF